MSDRIFGKPEILVELSSAFDVPASRIESTNAWRNFSGHEAPREVAQMITLLEEELRTSPAPINGMAENPYESPSQSGQQEPARLPSLFRRFASLPFFVAGGFAAIIFCVAIFALTLPHVPEDRRQEMIPTAALYGLAAPILVGLGLVIRRFRA